MRLAPSSVPLAQRPCFRPAAGRGFGAASRTETLTVDLGRGLSVQLLRHVLESTAVYGAGDVVWPAGLALARLLAHCPAFSTGRSVLELGAGLGAPSCAAALYASSVTVQDRDAVVLALAERSARLNAHPGCTVAALRADWTDRGAAWPQPQLVLAADVLYDAGTVPSLAQLLASLLAAETGARALIADPQQRPHRAAFAAACAQHGLECAEAPLPGPEGIVLLSVTVVG